MKRTLHRLWRRIDDFWWFWCRNFPRRIWLYRKWLAYDNDFDWSPLAEIMQIKLERMARTFDNGMHVGCERDAKECRIVAHLLRRIRLDEYTPRQQGNKIPEDDLKLVGKILGRKLRCWWD